MLNKEVMLQDLIDKVKSYNPNVDEELLRKAFELGDNAHAGQYRNSGEEFFIHPYNVALILADLNMDTATIIAGLLHDVVEDTDYTKEDIAEIFGEGIAHLVDGVTKLKKIKFRTKQESQAENLRKMILAMSKDIRVIIVKLADRLHNMRTLEYMNPAKKKEKALETLEIYAPLAHRLGISKIKWELEDLSLRYLEPEMYYDIVDKVAMNRKQREKEIEIIISDLHEELNSLEIHNEVSGRPKSFYSIYKKMTDQSKSFEEIFDLTAIRVLVDSIKDCYAVLGAVHTLWKPLPGRFKDYIAMPKPNMYQSLHTTVIGSEGEIFEVQIRTYDMHKTAEYGIAAHWKYKEGDDNTSGNFDENLSWLRELLEWQNDLKDPKDFMETLKIDFFMDEVFVFTPNGDVINLPMGSTPIDFAYRIHTDVGNNCIGSKVDGRIVPLNYKLRNGNIVEIITSVNSRPSKDWLDIVKSNQAKSKIRQWFKMQDKDVNLVKGKQELEKELRKLDIDLDKDIEEKKLEKIANVYSYNSLEDFYAAIGSKSIKLTQVITKINNEYIKSNMGTKTADDKIKEKLEKKSQSQSENRKTQTQEGVIIKEVDNIKIRLSKCCNPVPGDDIKGYITMGRGISVHRADCPNIINIDDGNRLIKVEWEENVKKSQYEAEIQVKAFDRAGLLAEVALKINELDVTMTAINSKQLSDGQVYMNLTLKINGIDELSKIIASIKELKGVIDVYRIVS